MSKADSFTEMSRERQGRYAAEDEKRACLAFIIPAPLWCLSWLIFELSWLIFEKA
jgi:hypothetical protein